MPWLGGVLLPELGEDLGFPEGRWSLWKVSDQCVDLGSVGLFRGALGAGCGPGEQALTRGPGAASNTFHCVGRKLQGGVGWGAPAYEQRAGYKGTGCQAEDRRPQKGP